MITLLPVLFVIVACLYAMAGFGGGSTYIALLVVSGYPLAVVPVISLACNLLVTSQGSFHLIRRGHAQWSLLVPLLLGSIPAAFLGGALRLPQEAFVWLLAGALSLAGIAMLVQGRLKRAAGDESRTPPVGLLLVVGVMLGMLAGITGIGGGIYLAPVMHLMRWGRAHAIAACTSLFIALNSLSGLLGQLTKGIDRLDTIPLLVVLGCPLAVLLGGHIGTHLLTRKLPTDWIRIITAGVILLVAGRLWLEAAST